MRNLAGVALLIAVLAPGQAEAAPEPQPYGTNDAGGVRNLLPPGSRGLSNAVGVHLLWRKQSGTRRDAVQSG